MREISRAVDKKLLVNNNMDQSIYGAMIVLSQDFTMRYPLVEVQGNNGSRDGDSPAAMRYTECRLTKIGEFMLKDLEKNTCDMQPNYDDTEIEPVYLPSLFPNFVNAVEGIAAGMATKTASYNLNEIIDSAVYIIDSVLQHQCVDENTFYSIIKGPDFPTYGNIIYNKKELDNILKQGKGSIKLRGSYEVETNKNNNEIIITEIPYKVNKANLVLKIDDLVKDGSIDNVKDVRDESDKRGIRIVIETKKDANIQLIINKLIKLTDFEISYSVNNNVIFEKKPKIMNMLEMVNCYLSNCIEIITRRSEFDLNKYQKRLNLVEAIIWAYSSKENVDNIIEIIRNSSSQTAINSLLKYGQEFNLNQAQAEYLIDIKLKSLTTDNLNKFIKEKEELDNNINRLNDILTNQEILFRTLKEELIQIKNDFGDERRTQFINDSSIEEIDCINEETLVITFSTGNIIKSVEEKEYRNTNRGAKGSKAGKIREDEAIKTMLTVNSKSDLLFFSNLGRVHVLKAYRIEKASRTAKGKSIYNYLSLEPNEKVITMLSTDLRNIEQSFLFATKNGIVKRLEFNSLSAVRNVTKVISFKEDDMLISVQVVTSNDDIILTTAKGNSIRFNVDSIKPTGRTAAGVRGIKLSQNDIVVDAVKVEENATLLTVTELGLAKRTDFSSYRNQSRGGKGSSTHKISSKTGHLVCATSVVDTDELFIATTNGMIARINVDSIRSVGKNSSGVRLINLTANDTIASVSRNIKDESKEELGEE